ncbi:MAG: apolipoprotein N-acyltransferase [Myxococcota bacterium]
MMRAAIAAAATGGALAFSVLPRPEPWLAFAYAVGVVLLARSAPSPRAAGARAWLASAVAAAGVFHWVVPLLERFAHFPWALAALVALLLYAALAIPTGLASWLAEHLRRRGAPAALVHAAALMVLTGLAPTLFPWRASTSWIAWTELSQVASLGGVALMDGLLFGCASCAAMACWAAGRGARLRGARYFGLALLPLLTGHFVGAHLLHDDDEAWRRARRVSVGVLQPNIEIEDKHDPRQAAAHLANLRALSDDAAEAGAELVVWPETAFPYPFERSRRVIPRAYRPSNVLPSIVGVRTDGAECERFNSAVAVNRQGRILGRSDKVELLAFGETIPLWDWLPPLQARFRCPGLSAGESATPLVLAGARFGILVCYEDVLPNHARQVAARTEVLINITNDGWFGRSAGAQLHHLAARWRAIETRRDLVRAVNTGVSAHVDSAGRERLRLVPFSRAFGVAEAARRNQLSLFLRFGDQTTPLAFAFLLACIVGGRRRNMAKRQPAR